MSSTLNFGISNLSLVADAIFAVAAAAVVVVVVVVVILACIFRCCWYGIVV